MVTERFAPLFDHVVVTEVAWPLVRPRRTEGRSEALGCTHAAPVLSVCGKRNCGRCGGCARGGSRRCGRRSPWRRLRCQPPACLPASPPTPPPPCLPTRYACCWKLIGVTRAWDLGADSSCRCGDQQQRSACRWGGEKPRSRRRRGGGGSGPTRSLRRGVCSERAGPACDPAAAAARHVCLGQVMRPSHAHLACPQPENDELYHSRVDERLR